MSIPGHKRGSDLPPDEQRFALSAYCHRFTRDHTPRWAKEPRPDGTPYMVQFASDAEWLANTWFPVTKAGRVRRARCAFCYSMPTWPEGRDYEPQRTS